MTSNSVQPPRHISITVDPKKIEETGLSGAALIDEQLMAYDADRSSVLSGLKRPNKSDRKFGR